MMCSKESEVDGDKKWVEINPDTSSEVLPPTFVDQKVLRMMKMMGYQSGLGLGKNKQGIKAPVALESQFDKRGLGLKSEDLGDWDFTLDNASAEETVEWLFDDNKISLDKEDMEMWLKEGEPILNISNEYNFCDKNILKDVVEAKNIFDELDLKDLTQARGRANPFETIRCVFFMNRASLKMANIDAVTGFMFTNIDQNPYLKDTSEPYYFADVCAGPGGFTEYILWRKKWLFKGFGLTLRGENDFKLHESVCACPLTFTPLYGLNGDGNVCAPENIDDFKEKVLNETQRKGVHFIMSDGGFSVEGNENIQEVLSKNIYICQCLVALEILRKHGHFVTKVFDLFTVFSVGLFYLLFKCFEKVCILKPNSSRPANSERYIICYNYKGHTVVEKIITYIRKLVRRLWELKDNQHLDIIEIVPLSVLKNDKKFYSYILDSNNRIAKKQTLNLQKLAVFCRNPFLTDYRQEKLRKSCLEFWQIPDNPKIPLPKYTTDDLLIETIDNSELLLVQPREILYLEQLDKFIDDINDWHYTLLHCKINSNTCSFYAGVSSSKVYKLLNNKWTRVKNLQLPRGTLLYGEFVREQSQGNKYCLHVIDALRLGDLHLTNLKFQERHDLIKVFCKSVNNEFKMNTIRIRQKVVKKLTDFYIKSPTKNGNFIENLPVLGYQIKEESYDVNSVLLLKSNESQSFQSSYVLRMQLFISNTQEPEKGIFYQSLMNFIKSRS